MRHESELAHHSMACLVQLSSLNGYVFAKKEDRLQDKSGDCFIEVPEVQINYKTVQVPIKNEDCLQENWGFFCESARGANR